MDINKIKDKYASYGLDRQYEKVLLDEIRKRDRKIHALHIIIGAGMAGVILNWVVIAYFLYFA